MNREEVAKALDVLGVTVTLADDPVDGSRIEVVHLDDLVRIGAVFEQPHTPTDDQRAEAKRVQKAAWAEIHGQDPLRKYSVAEVKQIVYPFDNLLSSLLAPRAEVEWEYGLVNETARAGEYGPHDRAHLVSRNREHIERQQRRGHPSIRVMRRRAAGPWVPVNENGEADG